MTTPQTLRCPLCLQTFLNSEDEATTTLPTARIPPSLALARWRLVSGRCDAASPPPTVLRPTMETTINEFAEVRATVPVAMARGGSTMAEAVDPWPPLGALALSCWASNS